MEFERPECVEEELPYLLMVLLEPESFLALWQPCEPQGFVRQRADEFQAGSMKRCHGFPRLVPEAAEIHNTLFALEGFQLSR